MGLADKETRKSRLKFLQEQERQANRKTMLPRLRRIILRQRKMTA